MLLSLLSSMIKSYHNHKQPEESPVGVLQKNDGHFCIDQKGSFAIFRSEKNLCLLFQSLLHVYRKRLMSLRRLISSVLLKNEKLLINLLIISQYFLGFWCNRAIRHAITLDIGLQLVYSVCFFAWLRFHDIIDLWRELMNECLF